MEDKDSPGCYCHFSLAHRCGRNCTVLYKSRLEMKKQLQCFVFWGGYSRVLWFLYSLLLLREYGNWLHLSNYTNKKLRSVAYVQAFSWVIFFQQRQGRGRKQEKGKASCEMEFLVIHLRGCHFNRLSAFLCVFLCHFSAAIVLGGVIFLFPLQTR